MSTISRCACAYEALAHQDGLEDSSKAYVAGRPVSKFQKKYTSGAVGSFTYVVALQGRMSNSEFDVFADGYRFRLINACLEPILYIRRPGTDVDEQLTFSDEDSEPSLSKGIEYAEDRPSSAFSVSALSPESYDALDISQASLMQAIRAASKREWKAAVEA
ncbi:hypothetical protein EWM64_g1216 [Hericium alpestre]|uniref:Oxidoreductase putative C-terminal domain-containing protein n=1 Tax=Hericium alpestre TaxID=135208 RepID=A0A4Z0A6V7_9AGAM|nr:hypothetical protein EWM64_g1216 [Hericium alpestre]